jgi:glutaredoxin
MSEILMYGLTTCPHCKKVLEFLKKSGVKFKVVWLDEIKGEERKKAIEEVHKLSGSYSVPVVVRGERWVLGYNPQKLKELIS